MSSKQTIDKISILKEAFPDVAGNELQQMAELTQLCSYPPGHVLCREGAMEDDFYILAEGSAIISKTIDPQGGEQTLRIAGKGDLIGEMGLIQNTTRSATVRTTTDCTALKMDKNDFETMLGASPSMAIAIIRTTLNRMRENDQTAIEHLQNTNLILQQLDRNKLEFIQVAAHELRTPLTVIKGYVELLRSLSNTNENPKLTEVMEGIVRGTERMHKIVNTMLDVTRIDTQTLELRKAPLSLKPLINDTVREFKTATAKRGIRLTIQVDETLPLVYADLEMLQKALYHLIVNAIKYTPDNGIVEIDCRPCEMENGEPGAEIRVRDSGIGLDAEHHKLVFEKFYQVGSVDLHSSGSTSFKGGGSGLGLAIVRGVALAHGGTVWVESQGYSEENFPGCTFYLQIPINPEE